MCGFFVVVFYAKRIKNSLIGLKNCPYLSKKELWSLEA